MILPLEIALKGLPYRRDALDVLYAKACGKQIILYFKNGEKFIHNMKLCEFEKLVTGWGYMRVHDSYVVLLKAIIRVKWLKAYINHKDYIPLSRKSNARVKLYVQRRHNRLHNTI